MGEDSVVRGLPNHFGVPEFDYVRNAEANPVRYHLGVPRRDCQVDGYGSDATEELPT
jgi:hypothetical protein